MTPIPAGWKPISSAPKDGTTVILGRDMGAFGFIRGYGYFAGTEGAFVSGWVSEGFFAPHGNLGLANPTHWMPLPAAPGAETPEEPITVALDPDPRGVSVGVWQGSHCIYTGAHAVPASVAPGDAQAVAWMNPETQDVITNERKDSWLTTYGVGMAAKAAAYSQPLGVLAAPAAGDALDAARYRWLRDQTETDGIAIVMKDKHFDESSTCAENIDKFIDAALAAQLPQQGEA